MEKVGLISVIFNISFAALKLMAGIFGHSTALIADGIESIADVFSSLIVWFGLRYSEKAADADHPYGHGKAESLAAFVASFTLLVSGGVIAYHAIAEIASPQRGPSLFTLPVVVLVILGKEALYRYLIRRGREYGSSAIAIDAWHHRLDSMTTFAVLVGILIAVIGGERYAAADDYAALFIACFIVFNAFRLVRPAVDALLDKDVEGDLKKQIIRKAENVDGVERIESARVTQSGTQFIVDIHIEVDPKMSVATGHAIAHRVVDSLKRADDLKITHVMTHVEPSGMDQASRPDSGGSSASG